MTGQEFRDYVLKKFKRTDKDTELYQACTDMIADMRIQFDSEDYKEEAYVAGIPTVGEYRIALPSDVGHVIGDITIIDTDTDESFPLLKKISKERYDELYPDRYLSDASLVDTARPVHYCVYGKQLFLGPVPDKTTYRYYLNYTTEDYTEVASGTTSVPFTDRYRNVLRAGVLAELHDGLENYQESQYWRAMYTAGLSKIATNDMDNVQDDDTVQFRGV